MERTEHGHYIPNDTLSTHGRPTISYNFSCSKFQNMNILVPINEDLNLMVYKVYSRIPVWLMPSPHLTSQVMAASNIVFQSCVCVCVASCSHSTIFYEFANHFHQPSSTSWRLEVFFEFTVPSHGKKIQFPQKVGGKFPTLGTPWSTSQISHISYQTLHVSISYTLTTCSPEKSHPFIAHLGWLPSKFL